MAEKTLDDVIQRMRDEGQLTRNSGSHSIRTVKELLKDLPTEQGEQKRFEDIFEKMGGIRSAVASNTSVTRQLVDNDTVGDDLENQREQNKLFGKMLDSLKSIGENTKSFGSKLKKAGEKTGGFLGSLAGGLVAPFTAFGSAFGATAGTGIGVGAAALGIGGGVALILDQVEDLMKSFDELAEGLGDLNELDIDVEKFQNLGKAINALASGTGIGGAIGLRILTGAAFNELAEGLETLNETEFSPDALDNVSTAINTLSESTGILSSGGFALFAKVDFEGMASGLERLGQLSVDPKQMENIGEGLNKLIEPLSASDIGEARVFQIIDDNLVAVASGVEKLNGVSLGPDFVDKMEMIGEGIDSLLSPLNSLDVGEATVLQMIDDNLPAIAEGAKSIGLVDGNNFRIQATAIGMGLQSLLDGVDDLIGATGIEMVDDNLEDIATGVKDFNSIVNPEMARIFRETSIILGGGFQRLLDGTDDLLGASGIQMVDDNVVPVSEAIRDFTTILSAGQAQEFKEISGILGEGFQILLDGTDDLFGATGLQSIDDNLIPFAEGVSHLNSIGESLNLDNFKKLTEAILEMKRAVGHMSTIDFSVEVGDADLALRELAEKTEDMRNLMLGLSEGGEREFNSLGFLGLGDGIDFGEGLLDPNLKLDEIRESIAKMQQVAGSLLGQVRIPVIPEETEETKVIAKPPLTKREVQKMIFDAQRKELEEQKKTAEVGVVTNAIDASQRTVNNNVNNNQTALLNPNMPAVDNLDRSWVSRDW
jgi:hypothetical protein